MLAPESDRPTTLYRCRPTYAGGGRCPSKMNQRPKNEPVTTKATRMVADALEKDEAGERPSRGPDTAGCTILAVDGARCSPAAATDPNPVSRRLRSSLTGNRKRCTLGCNV